MHPKKTLVIGASENTQRYSNLAVKKLLAYNHPVIALGKKAGKIDQIDILTDKQPFEDIDTITIYLNPVNQQSYYEYILSLHPKRIIFNPGTENEVFEEMARKQGIKTMEACILVMLSSSQY